LLAGFSVTELSSFFNDGMGQVSDVVIMFIFAILFFGVMNDVGLFDPIINKMITLSKSNIIAISSSTVIIAAIAHLDGVGASTFLITIPTLLPLYKRLNMNPYLLLLLVATSASVMNMVPWGGPVGRVGAVLEMAPTDIWRPLIPLQFIGLILLVVMAVILGVREKRRIAAKSDDSEHFFSENKDLIKETKETTQDKLTSGNLSLFWFNLVITLVVIGMLLWDIVAAGFAFIIALSIVLPVNYPNVDDQRECIKSHAPNALMVAAIVLAAGVFLGIMSGTGMLSSIAEDLVKIIPEFVIPHLHMIIGLLGIPFSIILSTDAYYFALFPIIENIVTNYGVSTSSATYAMIVGNIIGTFISPFSASLWLGLGLTDL
jgi:CitMHS family citrate-Mg2+:H+ or citrate-Ca2+:H+ symporter